MNIFAMIQISMRRFLWGLVGVMCLSLPVSASVYSHGEPTDFEQWMLEMVNAARADPAGESARLGIDLNQSLPAGRISTEAKQPLAFHPLLIEAARNHSDWMLDNGIFSHTGGRGQQSHETGFGAGLPIQCRREYRVSLILRNLGFS